VSDYEKKYNVCTGRISRYVDTLDEVREIAKTRTVDFVTEGYADYRDVYYEDGVLDDSRVEVVRRTTRTLDPEEYA
jgi:hypothetical protein